MKPPCQRPRQNPPEFWDLGNVGNRLALYLCRSCPLLLECADGKQVGVIRAGVAWSEHGKPLALCACGYPNTTDTRSPVGVCRRCAVPKLRRWDQSRKEYWRRYYLRKKARAA